ncbi:MAG: hypothetical protein WDW36_002608 [Sanguina aurantia]
MLCQILRDTSSGRDVSTAALEVIKVGLGKSSSNPTVKRLAMDVLKSTSLNESICRTLWTSLRLDISHSDGDISAAALDFLPHMPGTYLASLLIVGELAPAVSGHLSSKDCEVRTAAVGCLARVLLLPEVLLAAHSTPGLAASLEALWDSCGDALLDLESVVVATAVQAVTRLFRAAMSLSEGGEPGAAAADSGAGYVLCRLAARQALRVATALGPVLEMCQLLPYALQAHVAVMLPLLAGTVAAAPPQPPAILGAAPLPPAASLRVILPASTAYLLRHIHSIHSGTCLEACRQLIQIHRTFGRPDPGSGAPAAGTASLVGVSEGLSGSDVQCVVAALLQMRERQLLEAGLTEVALVVAQALPLLPASSRADTLRQLWPLLTRITDIPQRMAVAACAWQAVVTAELAGRAGSAAAAAAPAPADQLDPFATATMGSSTGYQQQASGSVPAVAAPYASVTSVLADPYLDILMRGRVPTLEGFSDAAESRPAADARPSAKLAAAARDPASLHVGDVPEAAAVVRLGAGQQLSPSAATRRINVSTSGQAKLGAGQQFSTLRHELVLMLVGVMRAQPGACAAAGLAWEAWAGARRDVRVTEEGKAGQCSALALQWLSAACATLDSTAACLSWEPIVPPLITAEATVANDHAAADFSTSAADAWLQLLQQCLAAADGLRAASLAAAAARWPPRGAGTRSGAAATFPGTSGGGGAYGGDGGGGTEDERALASARGVAERVLREAAQNVWEEVQELAFKVLSQIRSISPALRPRVLWVTAQRLALPSASAAGWSVLHTAVSEVLSRDVDGASNRATGVRNDAATAGVLARSSRQAWGRERPFLFDVACASALCESPEYESSSLHVSLVVLQLLTARLVNCASAAAAATAAAAKAAAAAGSDRGRNRASNNGRVSSSGVQDGLQSVDLAKGFEALLKALLGSEVTEEEEEEEAEDGVDLDPGSGQDGLPVGPVVTGSQDPDYDSDESSPRFAAPVANGSLQASPQVAAAVAAVPEVPAEESQARSPAPDAPWGYPFSGPRSSTLYTSKRARRQRALLENCTAALAVALRPPSLLPHRGADAAGAVPAGAGPVLSDSSVYRLDSAFFWDSVVGGGVSGWVELSGSSDVLLLRARCCSSGETPGGVEIRLTVANRSAGPVAGAEVHIKTSGPFLAERRGIVWEIPKLGPAVVATHSLNATMLGFGEMELQFRLQLTPTAMLPRDFEPLQVVCNPLRLPMTVALRPAAEVPTPEEFFRSWVTLPSRSEATGVCTWAGEEGAQLLLASLLRQPVSCVLMQHLPLLCGYQAAFAATVHGGAVLLLLVTVQLMPGAGGEAPDAVCQCFARSSSPEVTTAIQRHPAAWLHDISSGCLLPGLRRPAIPTASKPPPHPRVTALHQAYLHSTRMLPSSAAGSAPAGPMPASAGVSSDGGRTDGEGAAWVKSAALAEWQRLVMLS